MEIGAPGDGEVERGEAALVGAALGGRARHATQKAGATIDNARRSLFSHVLPVIGVLWVDRTRTDRIEGVFARIGDAGLATSTIDHTCDYPLAKPGTIADVTPGSTVVMGSVIGNYLAPVLAGDFEALEFARIAGRDRSSGIGVSTSQQWSPISDLVAKTVS